MNNNINNITNSGDLNAGRDIHIDRFTSVDRSTHHHSNVTWRQKTADEMTPEEARASFDDARKVMQDAWPEKVRDFKLLLLIVATFLCVQSVYTWLSGGSFNDATYLLSLSAYGAAMVFGVATLEPTLGKPGRWQVPRMRDSWRVMRDHRKVRHDFIEPNLFAQDPNDPDARPPKLPKWLQSFKDWLG